ncbi:MarR family transcriptional regulator [Mucilaginibacter sp. Bleaf8]|uniref:MarR family winged helix-turn-helix transcriptional regulator n=1 Tax=Mucilaginibacter sp. Bleaf8 TaxID=2834430 RepID=UPI001BCB4FC2|nr:MarR family transcriptional regulator [Mucilaginibacter sp. Bleaf8]MBS7564299.1 MarR family transcriptional regulator [Mucilaginibacter sp. Bleaf8]
MASKLKPHQETIDYLVKIVWQNMANRYNQIVADFGITQSIGYLLINIDEEEGTTVSQAAALMGLKSTSLSRMLTQLETTNLIYRQSNKGDKRSVKVFLTDLGKEKRQLAKVLVKQFNGYLNEHLTDREKTQLVNTLKKLNQLTLGFKP